MKTFTLITVIISFTATATCLVFVPINIFVFETPFLAAVFFLLAGVNGFFSWNSLQILRRK